ncbi:MAG: hypothetical protein JO288_07145 [Hyphomicrobiales bacterium]|nr:hypothetical protein [Hyphomicrobiales bacterium]
MWREAGIKWFADDPLFDQARVGEAFGATTNERERGANFRARKASTVMLTSSMKRRENKQIGLKNNERISDQRRTTYGLRTKQAIKR